MKSEGRRIGRRYLAKSNIFSPVTMESIEYSIGDETVSECPGYSGGFTRPTSLTYIGCAIWLSSLITGYSKSAIGTKLVT
jgi:hypothetical protein